LKDIDRLNVDDPTHDEDREKFHGRDVQSEVEPVAQKKTPKLESL